MVIIATLLVLLVVAALEWLHVRRIRRVAHLAFGPTGRPSGWVRAVPLLRVAALTAMAYGAVTLYLFDPIAPEPEPSPRALKQLLICLDVSPSMHLEDAGLDARKVTRLRRAGEVVQSIVDRLNMNDTRITLIAFYGTAIPVLSDTADKDLVANTLTGLPYYTAFKPGETNVAAGVNAALEYARPWARHSTTLVVVSDGDASGSMTLYPRPASISDALVIGVGDAQRSSLIAHHASRQDAASLKLLAARLSGRYFDVNQAPLPMRAVRSLRMATPQQRTPWGEREIGLFAFVIGATVLAFLGRALAWFGVPRAVRQHRRIVRSGKVSTGPLPVTVSHSIKGA